jgi:hypothetical protein
VLLKHQHSNSSSQYREAENGKCPRQDLLATSSKPSKLFPTGRLQQRTGLTIEVVETRTGRTIMPTQRIGAHLQKEAGVQPRMLALGLREADFKRLLPPQEAGDLRYCG